MYNIGKLSENDAKSPRRKNILSVNVEEYYQVQAFAKFIPRSKWSKLDSHVEICVENWLQLLEENRCKATFFAVASVVQQNAKSFRKIVNCGHEVATMGLEYQRPSELTPQQFEYKLKTAIESTQAITGKSVIGYRTPIGWLYQEENWIFDCLSRSGILYDSSECEIARNVRDRMRLNTIREIPTNCGRITRVPIATTIFGGRTVPIGGGNWVRQMPNPVLEKMIQANTQVSSPVVYYFHSWELDENPPTITSHQRLSKIRHYRNLGNMRFKIQRILQTASTGSICSILDYNQHDIVPSSTKCCSPESNSIVTTVQRQRVAILIPMFNESVAIPTLSKSLRSLISKSKDVYEFELILVDDGSTDGTFESATKQFEDLSNCRIIKHDINRGLSQALKTAAEQAESSVVCCIDADCTYDPELLIEMLPKLTGEIAIVTASPYHKQGKVLNVQMWRIILSKIASRLYSYVLSNKLCTYTSCFRVYDKQVLLRNLPSEHGFLGITQILVNADLNGYKIVEHPAVLEPRLSGKSKMKTITTIVGHLKLLSRILSQKKKNLISSGILN